MTTWILLRGLAREARHWGVLPELLERALPSHDSVMAVDLPGNGVRWRERSPASVPAMVAALREDLISRRAAPPYAVVALSLGGMVAMHWAATVPYELRACVLINSSARGLSPPWHRLRPRTGLQLARTLRPGLAGVERERIVWQATSSRPPEVHTLAQWAEWSREHPVARLNLLRQLVAAARFEAPRVLAVPALVLTSGGDRLVSPLCSVALARAWRMPLREHPHAGHDLALDAPQWVAHQIAGWNRRRLR